MERPTFLSLSGPTIWAAHFLLVYGAESLLCLRFAAPALHQALVLGATVLALAAIGLFEIAGSRAGWMRGSSLLSILSGVAVLWSGLVGFMLPSCVAPA